MYAFRVRKARGGESGQSTTRIMLSAWNPGVATQATAFSQIIDAGPWALVPGSRLSFFFLLDGKRKILSKKLHKFLFIFNAVNGNIVVSRFLFGAKILRAENKKRAYLDRLYIYSSPY